MIGDHAEHDDDKGAGRAADLNPASAQKGNQKTRDNRCDKTGCRVGARGDGDGKAEGQGNHRDADTRKQVLQEKSG